MTDIVGAVATSTRAEHTRRLVDAARRGDEAAFTLLVESHRTELHHHCYRMLGSVHDADDVMQESLLRAWRSIGHTDGELRVRPWLYKIVTNRCLTELQLRNGADQPVDTSPVESQDTDLAWLEPYPHGHGCSGSSAPETRAVSHEQLELAFVVALQHLSALQRAALLLREVLGFSAREVAKLLDTTVPAVNSALQRARSVVSTRVPTRSQHHELAALGGELRTIAGRYAAAWEAADVDGLVAMLSNDVRLTMPELAHGLAAVRAELESGPFSHRWRLLPTRANGQLAFGCYRWNDDSNRFIGEGVDVLTLSHGTIVAIDAFQVTDLTAFGLPSDPT